MLTENLQNPAVMNGPSEMEQDDENAKICDNDQYHLPNEPHLPPGPAGLSYRNY